MVRKEKERNRRRRKYGQAKLKHARRGSVSCVIAASVLLILVVLFAKAYASEGAAAPFIGGVGLVAFLLSGCSLYFALRGFKEREKNYLTCKIGMVCSVIYILLFIFIFCRGLF